MKIKKKLIYTLLMFAIIFNICIGIVKASSTLKVTADTLNLREKASTSSDVLTLISKDEECKLIEEYGNWYKVEYKSYTGYVSKEYVKKVENSNKQENQSNGKKEETTNKDEEKSENNESVEEVKVVTAKTSKETKARILPLIHSNVLETLSKGTSVEVITETNGWVYVATEKISAWIRSDNIEGKKTETAKVEDNKQEDKKEEANKDKKEENTSKQEEPKEESKNTNTIEEKTMYINDSYVNLRKQPSTSADIIMVVAVNTKLTVIGEEGDWYKVETTEGEAYVSKELLSTKKTTTTSRGTTIIRGATENTTKNNLKNPETVDTSKESNSTSTTSNVTETTNSSKSEEIVAYAKKFLGVPYVYGGASTSGFDCSGFTMYVYKKFGISMRHGAQAQAKLGTAIKADKSSASSLKKNLKAGDLVFFLDYETMDEIGHCGIYIGDGKFIHASSGSGYCVKINSLLPGEYYNTRYCAARRVI